MFYSAYWHLKDSQRTFYWLSYWSKSKGIHTCTPKAVKCTCRCCKSGRWCCVTQAAQWLLGNEWRGCTEGTVSLLFGKAPDVLWQCCSPAVRSTPGLMQTPLTGGLCSTLFQLNFPIRWWSWRLLGVAEIILSVNIVKARHVTQKCDSSSTNF